jgi:hypothetical protein
MYESACCQVHCSAVVFLLAAPFSEAVLGAAGWSTGTLYPPCGFCSLPRVGSRPLIEPFDVDFTIGLDPQRTSGRLDESPLDVMVHVATGSSVADAPAGGDNAGHKPGVAGQVLGSGKSFDVANLQPDERSENLADARRRAQ